MRLKIGTYNVHGWVDKDHIENLDRVKEVILKHDPDILCMQEVESYGEKNNLAEFSNSTNFVHVVSWGGCAVLAKQNLVLEEVGQNDDLTQKGGKYHCLLSPAHECGYHYDRPRYTAVKVKRCAESDVLFYLSCIHLSPKYSNLRVEEVQRIFADLNPVFTSQSSQLWIGDFNTLNPKDYTKDEWSNIVKQRIENGRQPPCHRVIQIRDVSSPGWMMLPEYGFPRSQIHPTLLSTTEIFIRFTP
ncbi:uncharacterized protein LOC111708320 isoform X2 [Eurytemora carolleeae]|uniref:uncharacterized protein LOC111708320 isoform X2 n=1 Tax=Eurytemora carolleeae TaxID=1294199 RepID=UPI000C767846|nr:uncharacterized protein LOC111708320 isoform X2 [Eurytemora carolleeae]|eukprot:XP_023337424.1 uncharacterized protein LOC111708320 isoform X2 [Eurytemora affinis]